MHIEDAIVLVETEAIAGAASRRVVLAAITFFPPITTAILLTLLPASEANQPMLLYTVEAHLGPARRHEGTKLRA